MRGKYSHGDEEIVRQRRTDMRREAEQVRLAHLAKGGTSGTSAVDRIRHLAAGLTENARAATVHALRTRLIHSSVASRRMPSSISSSAALENARRT